MAKHRFEVGDVVEIEFLDHAEGDREICFTVFGRVVGKDRKKVVVACWVYQDATEPHDENSTMFTILRSTIRNLWKLNRKKGE